MAQIGLRHMVCAPLEADGVAVTYGAGRVLAKAIQAEVSLSFNTADLWADDAKVDTLKEFNEGTLKLQGDYFSFSSRELLLGHKYTKGASGQPDRLVSKVNDEGNFVGVGFFATTRIDGQSKFRALWLSKVKFSESGETFNTKSGSSSFQTPLLEGAILPVGDMKWKEEALCETMEAAMEWLNAKANIVPPNEPGDE